MPPKIFKTIAATFLLIICAYSSLMMGTLFHELDHARHALCIEEIRLNPDASGSVTGLFEEHSHLSTYTLGSIIGGAIFAMTAISILILFYSKK